jgi:hypothetical protein
MLRAVVEAGRVGQTDLVAALDRDPIDIVVLAPAARIDEEPPVRRPAMKIGRRQRRDAPERSSPAWYR